MKFTDLGLSDEVLRAVTDAGYETPTPIQREAIPQVLMGRDVLGCAQTGTGKTASFTLPMIEILAAGRARARMPRSLILEPTRELAAQVAENFDIYGKYLKLTKALIIGGVSMDDQLRILDRGVDVLIATPGRLLDVFERGHLLLSDVKVLVIDEADRMLDMGFIPDVEKIVGLLSPIRQTLFFSATMPPVIRRLADAFLMNPKEITVSPPSTPSESVVQGLLMLPKPRDRAPGAEQKDKRAALRDLIAREHVKNALVFCNRKRDIGVLQRSLARHGLNAGQLHGDMSQPARTETLEAFKAGKITFLVCSDVAARGLDVAAMSHVFNFDVPTHAEDYVHRIGRTGRAGNKGRAFTIATPADRKYLASIESLIGKAIPPVNGDGQPMGGAPVDVPAAAPAEAAPAEPQAADDAPAAEESGEKRPRRRGRGGRSRRGQGDGEARKPVEARESDEAAKTEDSAPPKDARKNVPTMGEEPHRESGRAAPTPQRHDATRDRGREDSRDRGRDRNRRNERDDNGQRPVVGMGDHMPAFLTRPVKVPKS